VNGERARNAKNQERIKKGDYFKMTKTPMTPLYNDKDIMTPLYNDTNINDITIQ